MSVIEIVSGVALGNTLHLATPDWLIFLTSFGSVVLTFLAGAEVDPAGFRATWRASTLLGVLSFLAPVAGYVTPWQACHSPARTTSPTPPASPPPNSTNRPSPRYGDGHHRLPDAYAASSSMPFAKRSARGGSVL
ncbi:hypothetical protein GCM10009733_087420 [Nonomuraea maheshkhaliensis]|uniref:Cation/H+ exchanger transmembrane domain-containing protein n=1 Tax=Nonomuraea maheshkhaliensis TaxID=419590 RepID=A0ABP4SW09_9ACTN